MGYVKDIKDLKIDASLGKEERILSYLEQMENPYEYQDGDIFLHAYVDANDKSIFYYVDCSVIQDYGQIETFDNEHTVYERIKVGTADATLGTNNSGGRTGYVLVWEKDGISHTIIGKISREELLRIAESIS